MIEAQGSRHPGGFFTTRFVDAADGAAAAQLATRVVEAEVPREMWGDEEHRRIMVEGLWRVTWWTRRLWPARGFTFVTWNADEAEQPASDRG